MRKRVLPVLICCLLALLTTFSYAADGYTFELVYEGTVKVGEAKDVKVKLIGANAPAHTNVRIKVDITGPSVPTLIAYDSAGIRYDIAQIGYWGPDAGFPVQGTFTNETPVVATFDKAGTYTIVLSLIDVANSNNVITTKSISVVVEEEKQEEATPPQDTTNNTVENTTENMTNNATNNTVTEIPKTGTGVFEYALCFIVTAITIVIGYIIIRNNREL